MKKIIFLSLLAILLTAAVTCLADGETVLFTNAGLSLPVPAVYADLLVIETPENDEHDILFKVSEKASIDAEKAAGGSGDGAGWLFSIGSVSEERYHEMLCGDMSGVIVFAKNSDVYYTFYHPTDVRLVRQEYTDEELKNWGILNEWAASMKNVFIDENGLDAESHGNSELDIFLARLMYGDEKNYTVSTTEYGPMSPNRVKAADYIEPLVDGAVYQIVDNEEAPDGEYVVLDFPAQDIRFDFFLMEGKENYIRQVWFDGKHEKLYKAEFSDESIKASRIMYDLYLDMVLADSLDYTADDLAGVWADKISGRCLIEIAKSETEGVYDVMIHWGSSAFESYNWTMTAVAGDGPELIYEDAKLIDLLFTSEEESTETVKYENGKGSFILLSTYELIWNDETEHTADDILFINAGM